MDRIGSILKGGIFHPYDVEEALANNAVDFHAMDGEHTEVLGQFLDATGMGVNKLKDCLVYGYLELVRRKQDE